MNVGTVVLQLAPLSVENSSTPPSNISSRSTRCQKERTTEVALAGMEMPVLSCSDWSLMLGRSGAKADWAPEWLSVVTVLQPQPPGTQVATVEAKLPRPVS